MKKTINLLTVSFFFAVLVSSSVYAATLKCTVEKIEGDIVTMNCGEKAANLKTGTEVKVKIAKAKTAAIEGC